MIQGPCECFGDSERGEIDAVMVAEAREVACGVNDIELAREGAKESIFIAPGSVFCIDKQNPLARGIRINASRADEPRFYDFLLRVL